MLRSSQQIVSHTTETIIQNVQTSIGSIEKANANKPVFSAKKIFHVLGQLTDQVSYTPDRNGILESPKDLPSLRLDSYMSVFNVQTPVQHPRTRSLTKNYRNRRSTMGQEDLLGGFKSKRSSTYNKLEQLAQENSNDQLNRKDLQIYQKQCQQEDKLRLAFEKKIAQVIEQKRKTKPKFLSGAQLKQKFSYDYECKRIKVKSQVKNNLVSSHKSLTAELSKDIQKRSLPHKLEKTQSKTIQTHRVEERLKKPKKSVKPAPQQVQPEVQVQFSHIQTLIQNVECEPGVRINFDGQLVKNRRAKTEVSQTLDQQRKSSKLTSLKRFQVNQNQLRENSLRSAKNESFQMTSRQSLSDLRKNTNNLLNSSKQTKVSIQNEQMHKFLLAAQNIQSSQTHESQRKIQSRLEEQKLLTLDSNDKFNINYIRGTKNQTNHSSPQTTSVLPKSKGTYLKVRQKMESKMAFISKMKKRFQLGLRSSNITQNTQEVTQ